MTEHLHKDSGRNGEGVGSNSAIGRWTMPDSGAVFTMDVALIQKLRSFILEGFHILPKRGAEMGGILLGRVISEAPLAVEVTGFEPVPCEYRYGPSYILSDADRAKLEQALARMAAPPQQGESEPGPTSTVVGFFRSCTGRDLALDAADQQLMRKYFPEPRHFILSLRPLSIFECEAWFFNRINGVLPRLPSQPPEPFGQPMAKQDRSGERNSRSAQAAAAVESPEPAAIPVEPAPGHPAQAQAQPADEAEKTEPKALAARAGAGLLANAGVLPAEMAPVDQGIVEPPQHTRPGTEDLPGGDEAWRLVERRRMLRNQREDAVPRGIEGAPEAATATETQPEHRWLLDDHAAEPHKHRLWQLIAALLVLLVGGGAGYQFWDAQQRARWTGLGLDAKPGVDGMEVTWDRKSPALKEASRGVLEVVESGDSVGAGSQPRSVELDGNALSLGHFSFATSSKDVLFRLQLYSTGLASAVESVRVVTPGSPAAGKELASKPAAQPPLQAPGAAPTAAAAPKPAADEHPAPVATSGERSVVPQAPAAVVQTAGPPVGSPAAPMVPAAIPAAAIYEIQPTVPEGVRARIHQPITVTVQVNIDAQGRVTSAAARGDGDGVFRYLAGRAAAAAQSWKFRPARSAGGAAVSSTQLVYFTFRA